MKNQYRKYIILSAFIAITISIISCKKLIEVEAPKNSLNGANVFETDATASAVITGIYAKLSNAGITNGSLTSMSFLPALSSDELSLFNLQDQTLLQYYRNSLSSNSGSSFWVNIYPVIYSANSAIEGLSASNNLTPKVKLQLMGEAKFIRAFCYFYLVNLYGDVPLVLTTNYKLNSTLPRTTSQKVYEQIIGDLIDAQGLLTADYVDGTSIISTPERYRPNKFTATALLARVYLFIKNYKDCETVASQVIEQGSLYRLVPLNEVFLTTSQEAIWQLQSVGVNSSANTQEGRLFILPSSGPNTSNHPVYLNEQLIKDFEPGDLRKTNWIDSISVLSSGAPVKYYFPYKYKIGQSNVDASEASVIFRLGEQYLIRAEARANLNKLAEAIQDLNTLRLRARDAASVLIPNPLPDLNSNLSQQDVLTAIAHERKVELFTEWGHRWLDLKRTNAVDSVMIGATTKKGGQWKSTSVLYPIPQSEISKNPSLSGHQNPGY